jgi:hypothetical protein
MNFLSRLPQRWVLPIAILSFILPLIIIEVQVLSYTNGTFMYPLDDTFIHLTIAKNLALYHVWGTSPHEFASASSSILYPILLTTAIEIFGSKVIIPFALNFICAIILLVVIQNYLRKNGLNPLMQTLVLVGIILLVPLPVIVLVGMEHTLQMLFAFLFIYQFADWIAASSAPGQPQKWKMPWTIPLWGLLITATRYEGIFLIVIACLILIWYNRWWLAIALGLISILPIVIFGIYSIHQGSYFFPNPVLLKSTTGLGTQSRLKLFTDGLFNRLYYLYPSASTAVLERLIILLPATYLLFLKFIADQKKYRVFLIFLIMATLLHLGFGKTTWFFRYEVYILGPSLIIIGLILAKYGRQILASATPVTKYIAAFTVLAFFVPLIFRSRQALEVTKGACINIYGQQYQAGQFLHKYYNTSPILLNDLGAMGYFSSGKKLDMLGLGDIDFARSIREDYFGPAFLDSMAKREKVQLAILSNIWPTQELFPKWKIIGAWHSDQELIIGLPDIFFYAVDSTIGSQLKANLKAYEKSLPPGVMARYYK